MEGTTIHKAIQQLAQSPFKQHFRSANTRTTHMGIENKSHPTRFPVKTQQYHFISISDTSIKNCGSGAQFIARKYNSCKCHVSIWFLRYSFTNIHVDISKHIQPNDSRDLRRNMTIWV